VLIFPDLDACRCLAPGVKDSELLAHDRVRREFRVRLESFARQATGSSNRILRAILLETPPSLDIGEATDKGSINQRMVLRHRAAVVDELYAPTPSPRVIAIDGQ
jgi:feruloyl-CoA synthase